MNLSSRALTPAELQLLSKGLKFVPTISLAKPNLSRAFEQFVDACLRRLTSSWDPRHPFRRTPPPPTVTTPPPPLREYLKRTRREIFRCRRVPPCPNVTPEEVAALRALLLNPAVRITKADKGDSFVLLDTDQYLELAYGHLDDPATYARLPSDPTQDIVAELLALLHRLLSAGVIDKVMYTFLCPANPARTQRLYFLPKLHKTPLAVRPIVSCCSGPTETVSAFLDHFLQPMAWAVSSYVANSTDFLRRLAHQRLPPSSLLITLDVASLYTNISHEDARQVVRRVFTDFPDVPYLPPLAIVEELLLFVLEHNVFVFNGQYFSQRHGVAMGTKLAPALATLYLAHIEEEFLDGLTLRPLVWFRYIDDVFCVWTHGRPAFDSFLDAINSLRPRLHFTATLSDVEVVFLDLVVYKGPTFATTGQLDSRLYRKPTMHMSYVRGTSHHPPHTTRGVAIGETLRALRACSDPLHFYAEQARLVRRFRQLGFSRAAIRDARAIQFSGRTEALAANTAKTTASVFFVTEYARFQPSLTWLLRKYWLAVESNPQLMSRFQDPPMVSNKGHRNLQARLTRALVHAPSRLSTMPESAVRLPVFTLPPLQDVRCGRPDCVTCAALTGHSWVRSHVTHVLHPVDTALHCLSEGVVYCLECVTCGKQYVGQTGRSMRHRFVGHRYHFRTELRLLYQHLRRIHRQTSFDMDLTLLTQVPALAERLRAEAMWIDRLCTRFPRGLNARFP